MKNQLYLTIACVLIIILIVILMVKKYDEYEHLENIAKSVDEYVSNGNKQIKIKLKWINPKNNMIYYLGAIQNDKIDSKCEAFNFMNTAEKQIKPEYILVFVNQYYIQNNDCDKTNTCVKSKFNESNFEFYLRETIDEQELTNKKMYTLEFQPNDNEIHIMSYAKKNNDIYDNEMTTYGSYIDNLILIKQNREVTKNSKFTKTLNAFNIEEKDDGFQIYFDRVPTFSKKMNPETNKLYDIFTGTTTKFLGFAINEPCSNTECKIKTCGENDEICSRCCSKDHMYVSLHDRIFNTNDKTKSFVTTLIPETTELFKLRKNSSINNCAYVKTDKCV